MAAVVIHSAGLLDHLSGGFVSAGLWGVFFGMALESAAIPIPSEIILPFAGYLVASGRTTFGLALAAALAGGMVGALVSYWVARYGGRPLIVRFGRYVWLREHELAAAERWFARHGGAAVFFGRLLPGVRTYISLPAGVADMDVWRFFAYSLLGALPWTAALIAAGLWLGPRWRSLSPLFHRLDLLVVAAFVILAVLLVRRARRAARTRRPFGGR